MVGSFPRGRSAHALALSDPGDQGLAIDPDSEEEESKCEELIYAGREAYQQLTSEYGPDRLTPILDTPSGEPWNEAELERKYPVLWERWG